MLDVFALIKTNPTNQGSQRSTLTALVFSIIQHTSLYEKKRREKIYDIITVE